MPVFSRFARYFDEVARQGSLRKAADRLNVSTSAIGLMKMLVETGGGIALMNTINVSSDVASGRLVYRDLTGEAAPPSVLGLCVSSERQLSVAANRLLATFAEALRALRPAAAFTPPPG